MSDAANDTQGQWQPIETAPKDGSDVILFGRWSEDYGVPQVWVGGWKETEREVEEDAGGGLYRKTITKIGWWTSVNFFATHWMPLPAPPAGEAKEAA